MPVSAHAIVGPGIGAAVYRDVWASGPATQVPPDGQLRLEVPPHGSILLRVWRGELRD